MERRGSSGAGAALARRIRRGRGARGAAFVEALVVMPVFIVVFAALVYVREIYGKRQAAQAEARLCAFAHAAAGCPAGGPTDLPPGFACPVSLEQQDGMAELSSSDYPASGIAPGGRIYITDNYFRQHPDSPVDELKVIEPFGTGSVTAMREADVPTFFGGGTKEMRGRTTLTCNETTRPVSDLEGDFFAIGTETWEYSDPGLF